MEWKTNLIQYLKCAEKGHKLFSSIFGVVYLKDFTQIDGDIKIILTQTKLFGSDVVYNSDGTLENDTEVTLFPDVENRRWDRNWRWRSDDVKLGDIVVGDSTIFMANGLFYTEKKRKQPCALACAKLDRDDFIVACTLSDNRWTDRPISPANDKEIELFFKMMKEHNFIFDKERIRFDKIVDGKVKRYQAF